MSLDMIEPETEDGAERVGVCLPCVRPWVRAIAPEKKEKGPRIVNSMSKSFVLVKNSVFLAFQVQTSRDKACGFRDGRTYSWLQGL